MSSIAELKSNTNATIEASITAISPTRSVTTARGPGTVADATLEDGSGAVTFALWNQDIAKYHAGQKVRIKDGWVKEFKGKLQIALGRSGTVELLQPAPPEQTDFR